MCIVGRLQIACSNEATARLQRSEPLLLVQRAWTEDGVPAIGNGLASAADEALREAQARMGHLSVLTGSGGSVAQRHAKALAEWIWCRKQSRAWRSMESLEAWLGRGCARFASQFAAQARIISERVFVVRGGRLHRT